MINKLNLKNIGKNDIKNFINNNVILILLLVIVAFVGFTTDNFLSMNNFSNIAKNASVRFIVALGVSGCLITKGTDLSAGRIIGLSGCIAATLLQYEGYTTPFFKGLPQLPMFAVILLAVVVAALIGLVNGLVIAYLKVPPFIATLGMQQIVYGACLVYSRAEPIGGLREEYKKLATGSFMNIPYLIIIAVVIGIFMWFLYNMTRHGKYMYAVGGNESAAEVSGVNTIFTKLKIYALAGALYGIAGILVSTKSGGASVGYGAGYELEAIAACTIGGVSTTGGVGKVSGILIGVFVFELLKTSLQFLKVNPAYQNVVQGLVIVVAVAFDIRKYIAKK